MSEELYRATVRIAPDMTGFDEEARAGIDAGVPDRKDVKVGADTAEAQTKIVALDEEVKKLDRDASSASRSMHDFGGGLSGISVATAALLPAMPVLAGGIGALAASLTAAGAASIGFSAVFATGIHEATKANQELLAAQKAVNDATTKTSRQKALEEQAALIKQLGPAVIGLGQGLHDVSQTWKAFADSFIPQELLLVAGFERLEKDVLPQLKPLISATFGVARDELAHLDAAVNSPGGHSFFSWLATEGPRDLRVITDGLGGFAAGFGHLLIAFTPVEHQLVDGFDRIGAKFAAATSGLDSNGGFQKFLTTVEKDGPMLVHTLGDAASAIGHIGLAMGGVLPYELKFIDGVLTLVNKSPAIAGALGVMYLGFESMKVISKIVGPLGLMIDLTAGGAIKLATFALAEDAVGASGGAAAGGVDALAAAETRAGLAADTAFGKVGALIRLLGGGSLLGGLATLGAIGGAAGGVYLEYKMAQDAGKKGQNHFATGGDPAMYGPDTTGGTSIGDLIGYQGPGNTGTINSITGPQWQNIEGVNAAEGGATPVTDLTGGGYIGSTNAAEGPGGSTSSTPDYLAEYLKGLNNPANMLPFSSGGGSGTSAAAKAAQNNAAATAYLLGISIPTSLAQGIAAGTNPLTATFQNLNQKLTGTAQTLGNSLESAFNTALQYGQQVSKSLTPNLISGLPQMGTMTNVTMGPDGKLTSTVQSPILGGLRATLGNDQQFVTDIAKAKKLGLSSTILGQFVQAGPSSLSQLDQLVNGSPDDIASINSTFGQITSLGNQYGLQQAANQYLQGIQSTLTQLLAALVNQPPAVGKAVTAALNGVAKSGQQLAAATPSLGVFSRG